MSELNWLDKTKSFFDPAYGFKASQLRKATNLLFDGATQSPHYNISIFDELEDEELYELQTLRATSNEKFRNNGFYKGVINAATDHVIGSGLKAKSTIQKRKLPHLSEERIKEVEAIFDDHFNAWADSTICDSTAKDNFYTIQRLAYKLWKKDGESLATLPLTPVGDSKVIQISLAGAHSLSSNKTDYIEGIKLSKNKMPLKYSFMQSDGTYKEISAFSKGKRNVLHVFTRESVKQVRGLPFMSAVMRDVDAIDQYMKYEMQAAKLAAIFFGSIQTNAKTDLFGNETDLLTGEQTQTKNNTVKENSITQLAVGDELKIHQQGRDNPNYDKFVLTNLQKVASQTRMPLEIIMTIFASSYSASRASMLLMGKFVDPERVLFNTSFNKPTREQVLTWAVLNGEIIIPDFFEYRTAYLQCVWMGAPIGSVDPTKDIKAKVSAINANLCTREQATIDLGYGEFEVNADILSKEKELLIEKNLLVEVEKTTEGNINE